MVEVMIKISLRTDDNLHPSYPQETIILDGKISMCESVSERHLGAFIISRRHSWSISDLTIHIEHVSEKFSKLDLNFVLFIPFIILWPIVV